MARDTANISVTIGQDDLEQLDRIAEQNAEDLSPNRSREIRKAISLYIEENDDRLEVEA